MPRDFDDNDISKWGLPPGTIRRFGQGYASDMAFCSHNGVVAVTTTSPDNTILASSGTDGTILLWDMKPYLTNA